MKKVLVVENADSATTENCPERWEYENGLLNSRKEKT